MTGRLRVGIDVGGTNTDAVVMDGAMVVSTCKRPTTRDVSSGIIAALENVLGQAGIEASAIGAVMLGTTHFTNAVVERERLMTVAALRLALPATEGLPPMIDWPSDLRTALGGHTFMVGGGNEYDGRLIAPLDESAVRAVAAEAREQEIQSFAITSVFSPIDPSLEQRAAEIVSAEIPGAFVTLSHEIGRIGLLERENATIINASLRGLARSIVASFRAALVRLGIQAPFFVSQNDGTLMSAEYVERYPVLTFASGPTNSMRGAAFLSGVKDAIVVDIGGTTSDVGMLLNGFPRESSIAVDVAGVRTSFRMPDVLSVGLGGGSRIRCKGELRVGPDSVGYELPTRGRVFGGDTLTATDIAVAAGLADIGDKRHVADLDPTLVQATLAEIQRVIENAVDRVKTSLSAVPVVLVGGGTILVGDQIHGASELIRPDHFAVANAIGAAIAQVGGETDRVFALERLPRSEALAEATREATSKAIAAGADPKTVQVVDVEEVPLSYLPSNAARIRVKVVGDLVTQ
ncbi:MAG: hydantoinase/oxoprolinase family protein [Chloroflexota bacterium]